MNHLMNAEFVPPTEAGIYVRKDELWEMEGWTSTPNALIRDERIGWDARGAFTWMASHSSTFRLTSESLAQAGPRGRNHAQGMLRELERFGWLTRNKYRNPATGRYDVTIYHLHVRPVPVSERTYSASSATRRVGEFSQVTPETGRVGAGTCGQLPFPQVTPATGKPGAGKPGAGVPGPGRVDAYKKTNKEEPPYPPDESGGTRFPQHEQHQPPLCPAHGRRSCRPCGTSPRAQQRAAAEEAAAAEVASLELTRACRMCNPEGWRLDAARVPITPWVRCDHVTAPADVLAALAVREPAQPPAGRVPPAPPAIAPPRGPRVLRKRGVAEVRAAARAELDASRERGLA